MSHESLEKLKAATEALLASWGVRTNPHLPLLEDESEVHPRSGSEIARRICALGYMAGLGFGDTPESVLASLTRYQLLDAVSARERGLLEREELTDQERIDCSWLTEAIQTLMWAIGRADLDHTRLSDDDLASRVPLAVDPSEFVATAQRKPLGEIQRECDLLYRLHWFSRHCRLDGAECRFPEGLVWERRRALDWVYGVDDDWDEIPGDT